MKKLLFILLTCFSLNSFAQLADGIAPNFTVQDINGNSHTLYDYLDAGYYVVMDVSATWCPPCWNYHSGHHLKTIWENHGPAGEPGVLPSTTDDVVVLFVEGDNNTGMSQLNGTASSGTQGNWIEGIDYPIIDDASITSLYEVNAYPTIFTICQYRNVTNTGQVNGENYYNTIINLDCAELIDGRNLSAVNYIGLTASCGDFEIGAKFQNLGTETINEFTAKLYNGEEELASETYNGELGIYESVNVTFGTFNFEETTDIKIKIDENDNFNGDNEIMQQLVSEKTQQDAIVKVTTDNFGSQCSWKIKNETGSVIASGGPYADHSNTSTFVAQVQDDQQISIEQGGCYTFEVNDSQGNGMYFYDPTFFRILDMDGNTILNINGNEYSSDISKEFYNINPSEPTSISEFKNEFALYPNPANEMLNIEFDSQFNNENTTVTVSNMLGKDLIKINNIISNKATIDISSLTNGIYFVNTSSMGKITSQKFVVLK